MFKKGADPNRANGRPKGSRNKQKLLADHIQTYADKLGGGDMVQVIVEKLVQQSLGGCIISQKILIERLIPAIKQTTLPVKLDIPKSANAIKTADLVVNEILNGQLSPDIGKQILDSLAVTLNIEQAVALENRIQALEEELIK